MLAFLRAFASSQGCSCIEALDLCKRWPRLFDAAIWEVLHKPKPKPKEEPESPVPGHPRRAPRKAVRTAKHMGESAKHAKERILRERRRYAERVSNLS